MAITKNTQAAVKEAPAIITKPSAKADVKPAAKPAAKPAVKAVAKPVPKQEVQKLKAEVPETETSDKVSRKELALSIQEKVKESGKAIPLGLAELVVSLYEESIIDALAVGKEVNLPGFGKFISVHREEQERPNPQKPGEKVVVAAHNAPKFKPGTGLKKALNDGAEVDDE